MKAINPNIIDLVELGAYANDGTGDDLRTAFIRVNNNFELLNHEYEITDGTNLGSGTGVYAGKSTPHLQFKSLTSTDNSVTLTNTATTVNLQANTIVEHDTTPHLGGTLLMNGHIIDGNNGTGDVQSTVHGIDVPMLYAIISAAFSSGSVNLDLGTLDTPSGAPGAGPNGYAINFGSLLIPVQNVYDFGTL